MNRSECLNEIMKIQFYCMDLSLYLDNFPTNKKANEDFKLMSSKLRKLVWDYEQEYGPITSYGSAYIQNPTAWVTGPWPWENESKGE